MSVRALVIVVALLGCFPRTSYAQPTGTVQLTDMAPDASCAWHAHTMEQEREVARRLALLQQEFSARPTKGALISLVVSGVLTMGGILTAALYTNSEYQSVPALWSIPGATAASVIVSGAVLGLRLRQRAPFKARQKLLLRQQAQLALRRETFATQGCIELPEQRIAAARAAEVDARVAAVKDRAREISLAGPGLLVGLGAVGATGALVTGIVLLVIVSSDEEGGGPVDRTPMRVSFGMIPVAAAVMVGGGVWLARRKRQRRAIMETGRPLQREGERLDIELAPQVGPSSLGVSWRQRF